MQNDRHRPDHEQGQGQGRTPDPHPLVLKAIREVTQEDLPGAVASILLIPALACRLRPCRRNRDCALVTPAGQPACLAGPTGPKERAGLAGLDPALRALHEALHGEALRFLLEITGPTPPPVTPPSRNPDERELQDAAVAVVRAMLPRNSPLQPRIRAWCRARDAVTAPPYAGRDLLDLRDFLRYIGAKRIAPVTGEIPAPRFGPAGR